jgi:hypothetical protein
LTAEENLKKLYSNVNIDGSPKVQGSVENANTLVASRNSNAQLIKILSQSDEQLDDFVRDTKLVEDEIAKFDIKTHKKNRKKMIS